MVISIAKPIEARILDYPINLPLTLQSKIEEFWQKQVEKNPYLFNGEVWSVSKFQEFPDKLQLLIQKTDYAHYLYDERVGIDSPYSCYNLNCGILLETNDHYYVVGEMNETTSYPHGLQISGGNLDDQDILPDGKVDLIGNVARELNEELNLTLFDSTQISSYQFAYLELPQGKRHSYAPMMKGQLTFSAKEMEKYYQSYQQSLRQTGGEIEFECLHFIPKDSVKKALAKMPNPKRPYLEDLLTMDQQLCISLGDEQ